MKHGAAIVPLDKTVDNDPGPSTPLPGKQTLAKHQRLPCFSLRLGDYTTAPLTTTQPQPDHPGATGLAGSHTHFVRLLDELFGVDDVTERVGVLDEGSAVLLGREVRRRRVSHLVVASAGEAKRARRQHGPF